MISLLSFSEKVNEVFGSSDLPLLNDNDCGSIDMENSSGKNLIDRESHFVRSTNYKGMIDRPLTFNSSASTNSSRFMHQQENASEYGNTNTNKRRAKSFRHFPTGRSFLFISIFLTIKY